MKESILMRVLLCKIHCPFICFCKPSAAAHLYASSGPLKLENTPPQAPSKIVSISDTSDHFPCETVRVIKEESLDGKEHVENVLKSCIKKPPATPHDALKETTDKKKKVQWIDDLGKELAEIKEFESSETGENDLEEENRGCVCVIL